MNLEITKERDTPLLSRKRYSLYLDFSGKTPSRLQIRDAVAAKIKSDPKLTIIKHIYTRYGVQRAKVIANVYSKKEDLLRYEDKDLIKKHEEKKKEEGAEEKK
jgi:ribosomal protein S24E